MSEKEKKENGARTGGISVEAEHIFPVIKKWLYSDKEIFLREIVSNAIDAETKLKRLVSLGETEADPDALRVDVTLDREAKTLTVADNGIGMTEEEVEKYLCSIALSGALDFIQKYEGEGEGAGSGIIGHFGLGFYSAFMVADTVDVYTKSFTGAPAVRFTCDAAGRYEISPDERQSSRGTTVVLHLGEEGEEFAEEARLRSVLEKYCSFMPEPIYFTCAGEPEEEGKEKKEEKEEKPINDTAPLWLKPASECTKEEYTAFYRKVFGDWREPLLTVHISADYPLNFKGIFFFPRKENDFENVEGQVKLYYNQTFVADNIKEVVPEYLLMLRGVLDCPELPLNVSRSYLQSNGYVKKIAAFIVKKVADKLVSMKENDREGYEKIWNDIRLFTEYSCICDEKFYDRAKDAMLLPMCGGGFKTLAEYLEAAKETNENKVYYATDPVAQAQFIRLYSDGGIAICLLDKFVDTQYISFLEGKNDKVKFLRVDADAAGALKAKDTEDAGKNEALEKLFRTLSRNENLTLAAERLRSADVPAILSLPEESRRFDDMMKFYTAAGSAPAMRATANETLTLNLANETAAALFAKETFDGRDRLLAKHLYALAALSQRKLSADELQEFLADSYRLLTMIPEGASLPETEADGADKKEKTE